MKTICIKTNNSIVLDYLLNELRMSNIQSICFTQKQFKHYNNIIIHYNGQNEDDFIHFVADILSYLIIDELEEDFLSNIIQQNYCYFDLCDRKKILNYCFDLFSEDYTNYFDKKFSYINNEFYLYLKEHKSIVLTGFINFRLKKYFCILDDVVDEAVNSFIIEKEYLEFVSLLKLYINSQAPKTNVVHLIYRKDNPLLLDEHKNVIPFDDSIYQAKYLSDISFSKNDFILNTLILIFENKIQVCSDCNICNLYNLHKFGV